MPKINFSFPRLLDSLGIACAVSLLACLGLPILVRLNYSKLAPGSAVLVVGSRAIDLDVARTPEQQREGLMHRPSLPRSKGMLFPVDPPRKVKIWMKDVAFPLDVVFVRFGRIAAIASSLPPCRVDNCPVYTAPVEVDAVIELSGSRATELGMSVGQPLAIKGF